MLRTGIVVEESFKIKVIKGHLTMIARNQLSSSTTFHRQLNHEINSQISRQILWIQIGYIQETETTILAAAVTTMSLPLLALRARLIQFKFIINRVIEAPVMLCVHLNHLQDRFYNNHFLEINV